MGGRGKQRVRKSTTTTKPTSTQAPEVQVGVEIKEVDKKLDPKNK